MKIPTRSVIFVAASVSAVATNATSIFSSGDTVIHAFGEVAAVYESNVYQRAANRVSDYRLEFVAGIELQLSPQGAANTTLKIGERFIRWDSEPLNDEFLEASFSTAYDSGVLMSNAYASYTEAYSSQQYLTSPSDAIGVLALRDTVRAGGSVKYDFSDLTSVKAGVDYSDTSYSPIKVNGQTLISYSGHEAISVPVTAYYNIRPKVDLTAGLRYRQTEADSGLKYDDMYYYVGAVGELFSPVVYADVTIGYQTRDSSVSRQDETSSSFSASLTYTGNPKGTAFLTFARDFRTSAIGGANYVYDSATLGAQYSISDAFGVHGAVAFGKSDYQQYLASIDGYREDDIQMVRVGASYRPNDYLKVDASFYYHDVDGNIANYSDTEFRVTASLRY